MSLPGPPLWKRPSRKASLVGAAFCFLLLIVGPVSLPRAIRDAAISLFWPRFDATVLSVAAPGAWQAGFRDHKGYPYDVTLAVAASDGRVTIRTPMEPLFSSFNGQQPVPEDAVRPPPRVGDQIEVHVDPDAPDRVIPRENLVTGSGTALIVGFWTFFTLFNLFFAFTAPPRRAGDSP